MNKRQTQEWFEKRHPDDQQMADLVVPWLNPEARYNVLTVDDAYLIVGQFGYRGGVDMFDLLYLFKVGDRWHISADCQDKPIREIFDAMQRRMQT